MNTPQNPTPPSTPEPVQAPPRRRRRWGRWLLAGLVVLLLIVAAIPHALSSAALRGTVQRQVSQWSGQPIAFDALTLSWFGPPAVRGLRVGAPTAGYEGAVDVRANTSAWDWIRGRRDVIVDVSGGVTLHAPPSTKPTGARAARTVQAAAPELDVTFPLPSLTVRLADVAVTLQHATAPPVRVTDVKGEVVVRAGAPLTVDLGGAVASDQASGPWHLAVTLDNAVDADGRLHIDQLAGSLAMVVPQMALADGWRVEGLELQARSADLSRQVRVEIDGQVIMDGQASPIEGWAEIDQPLAADGVRALNLDRVQGSFKGDRVPVALLEPLLADTPLVAERDLGQFLDVSATFDAGTPRRIQGTLRGAPFSCEVRGSIDGGALTTETLTFRGKLHPDLLSALGAAPFRDVVVVDVAVEELAIPAPDASGQRAWKQGLHAAGRASLVSGAVIPTPEGPVQVEAASVQFALAAGRAEVNGVARVAGGQVLIEQQVADVFGDPAALWPVGRIAFERVPAGAILPWLPESARAEAGAWLQGEVNATVRTTDDNGRYLTVDASSGRAEGRIAGQWAEDRVLVHDARAAATVEPADVGRWLADDARLAQLEGPARLTATVEGISAAQPLEIRLSDPTAITATARIQSAPLALTLEGERRVHVDSFDGVATLLQVEPLHLDLRADAIVMAGDRRPLAPLHVEATLRRDAAPWLHGAVQADPVVLGTLMDVLGESPDTVRPWVGDHGTLAARFALNAGTPSAHVTLSSSQLTGEWVVRLADDQIKLTANAARMTWPAQRLTAALFGTEPGRWQFTEDIVLTPTFRRVQMPLALLTGGAVDPASVAVVAQFDCPTLALAAGRESLVLRGSQWVVNSTDLGEGIDLRVTGRLESGPPSASSGTAEGGDVVITAHVDHLMNPDGGVDWSAARLDLDATVPHMPLAALDRAMKWDGQLTSALGDRAVMTLRGDDFSADGGQARVQFRSTLGQVMVPRIDHHRGGFRVPADPPVTAAVRLEKPLRDRLLRKIHPVLADIRTVARTVDARIAGAWLPLDGDLSRLSADVDLEIGEVTFEPGVLAINLLKLGRQTLDGPIPGRVEPIKLRIRDGVIRYERFAIYIDKHHLNYTGTIDLNTGLVDLRTEVPLDALAIEIKELTGFVEGVGVPIVLRGPIDNPRPMIDPEFELADVLLQRGLKKGLDGLIEGQLGDLLKQGDLGDLLGQPKKPEPASPPPPPPSRTPRRPRP